MNMAKKEERIEPQSGSQSIAQKLAQKVIFISEREMEIEKVYLQIGAELLSKLHHPDKIKYFQSLLQILLEREETAPYASHAVVSLFWQEPAKVEFKEFWKSLVEMAVAGHSTGDMPSYRHPDSGRIFSAYAHAMGETFIQMMKVGSDNYDVITQMFSHCIRYENDLERERREAQSKPRSKDAEKYTAPANPKKLYDDISDYISERAIHRARTLNPDNPNEFIQILSDRMRSTRRYVIQDLINKDSLEKKRATEKAFKEKLASAEELIFAGKPFLEALKLFKDAKLYNNRYVEAEKKRLTLQLVPLILALGIIGFGAMDLLALNVMEMVAIGGAGISGRFLFSQKMFNRFYPKDITGPLEEQVALVAAVFQKCSKEQLAAFLRKQLKAINDPQQVNLVSDFVTYVFSVIPKKRGRILSRIELKESMDSLSWHIARARRGLTG
ncbi:MAG: hypothetical protein A2600_09455 [Candidatus Lambdaproteobacteria bacterium RIFOXYD1_FULL_56_27]|nr:MAG: hypothetical protein A2426_03205 [Candidatus Lambdaproteobacteria bacterium RIFOXYC1_FULL_56_13]OGH10046.1 MAG: hypothetical protein A2600_09455 [Candidatus Lambdaproteobacteria bacterium RIFOXYD1_FULL_56_27]